jgi:hypothetical protein
MSHHNYVCFGYHHMHVGQTHFVEENLVPLIKEK